MPFSSFPTSLTDAADNEVPVEDIFKNFDGVTRIDVPEGVEKIGIVRMDAHFMSSVMDAISRLRCVPTEFDIIALALTDVPDGIGSPRSSSYFPLVDNSYIEDVLERFPGSSMIYDIHGTVPALFSSSMFEFSCQGQASCKFLGNVAEIARDEQIVDKLKEELLVDITHQFAQSLAGRKNTSSYENTFASAESVFRCITMDRLDFPVTETDVEQALTFRGKPTSLTIFADAGFDDRAFEQKVQSIENAERTFTDCLKMWDWAIKMFGIPLTLADYPMLTNDDESWKLDNMVKFGKLIGMDIAMDTLQSGVDVQDIIA